MTTSKAPRAPFMPLLEKGDLPDGTFVYLDDGSVSFEEAKLSLTGRYIADEKRFSGYGLFTAIFRIKRSTPNGILFEQLFGWRVLRQVFKYRHAIREMVLVKEKDLRNRIPGSFWHQEVQKLNQEDPVELILPKPKTLERFVRRWGQTYLAVILTAAPKLQGGGTKPEDADAWLIHLTHRTLLKRVAKKAKDAEIRAAALRRLAASPA